MAVHHLPTKSTRAARATPRARVARVILLFAAVLSLIAGTQKKTVVRAVLFFSPSCPHCHDVMDNHLPPLLAKHGDALQIVAVNVETPDGQALYQRVALHFTLPRERLGVPALVVGDRVLVGSGEIPADLPGIVAAGIAAGGIGWPDIDAVHAFLRQNGVLEDAPTETSREAAAASAAESRQDPSPAAAPAPPVVAVEPLGADPAPGPGADSITTAGTAASDEGGLVVVESRGGDAVATTTWQRFRRDPIGNSVSVMVLLAMIAVVALATRGVVLRRPSYAFLPGWAVPVLTFLGIGIAAYMSFVEVTHAEAVCGPVGDCNAVQSSAYAAVLGIPVGILGLIGYAALGAGWYWLGRAGNRGGRGAVVLWSAALAGVVFSIYLTFLEPFVIGATCIWCLSSAVVMTLILMALTQDVVAAPRGAATGRAR